MPTPEQIGAIVDVAGQITVVGLLLAILIGGAKEKPWWVFGATYRRELVEKKIWRALALKGAKVTEDAIQKAGQALDLAERKKNDDQTQV